MATLGQNAWGRVIGPSPVRPDETLCEVPEADAFVLSNPDDLAKLSGAENPIYFLVKGDKPQDMPDG